jgi:hypothetical protein
MCDKEFIPDLLTDEGPSTGYYAISCVVRQLSVISKKTAACGVNLSPTTRVDGREWDS